MVQTQVMPQGSVGSTAPQSRRVVLGAVALITALGLFVRLYPALGSTVPLNDGGLFTNMIRDVQANSFRLPMVTTYNASQIPFAYPPLALYVATLISSVLGIPALTVVRLLPPLLSAATIPAFFLLARRVLKAPLATIAATALYAFAPQSMEWQSMGGGLTRSLGALFAILTIDRAIRFCTQHARRDAMLLIAFGSLTLLSHPEAALHTALAVALVFLFLDRTWRGAGRALLLAGGVLLVAAPWWATILLRHGIGPFVAVFRAAGADTVGLLSRLFMLFTFNVGDEPFLTLIGVLGLIGAFFALSRRRVALPIWFAATLLLDPRGGRRFAMLPLALLGGIALADGLIPAMRQIGAAADAPGTGDDLGRALRHRGARALTMFLIVYLLTAGLFSMLSVRNRYTLQASDLAAMEWIRAGTDSGSRFVLVTQGQPLLDPASEWFPVLAERTSAATVFGMEWVNDAAFGRHIQSYNALQQCAAQSAACLDRWSDEQGLGFDYVYLRGSDDGGAAALIASLSASDDYVAAYDSPGVTVFRRLR